MSREITDILRRASWKLLLVRALEWGAVGAITGGLCASVLLGVLCALALVGAWTIPLVFILLGFAIGVAVRVVRGVTLREVVMFLDARCALDERLSTTVELLDSPDPDVPLLRYLCEQSLDALD